MSFVIWFSIFSVLAWYQQQHWEKFNGSSQNFYTLLSAYCLLNLIFGFVSVYMGFKIIGWWFLLAMILAPLVMQTIMVVIENAIFNGHSCFKLSFAGLLLIPVSIWQMVGWQWALLYILVLIVYFIPVLRNLHRHGD